jgi:hypothetical protein
LKGKAGEAPQEHEPTTHGVEIDIHGLRLPHPTKMASRSNSTPGISAGRTSTASRTSSSSAAVRSTCWSGSRAAASSRVRSKTG